MTRKARSDSKLKQLTPEQQEQLWELLTIPQGGKKKPLSLDEAKIEVPLRYGFTTSRTALSEFYAWYAQRLRMENAVARAEQAKLQWAAKNPDASLEDLESVGQMIFTASTLEAGDIEMFVKLKDQALKERKLKLDREKLLASTKEKVEAGLDALYQEIKGNANAERIFAELKEVLSK